MASDTKSKIMELLSSREMTLTELSQVLNLAPSTVNQHIKELLAVGAIRQIPNQFVIKQKYYEVDPDFHARRAHTQQDPSKERFSNLSFRIAAGVIAVAVLAGLLYMYGFGAAGHGTTTIAQQGTLPQSNGETVFSISDSPAVISVSSVNMIVANAMVHSETTGEWYTVLNTSEHFNLVELRNISQTLTTANLPVGSYNEFVLHVSNVTADVNGTPVGVLMPSMKIDIFGNFSIGSNTATQSWINLDIDLARSLHMTGNGELVMLPYTILSASTDSNLSVASNGIIYVKRPGRTDARIEESMGSGGNFTNPSTSNVRAGEYLNVSPGGKVEAPPPSQSQMSEIAIRGEGDIVLLTNITNATSVIQNFTEESNATFNATANHGGPMIPAPMPNTLKCTSEDRFVDCETPGNITVNATAVIPPPPPSPYYGNGSVTANAEVDASNPSNLPEQVNSSLAACSSSTQCIVVPTYPCQNTPMESACINSQNSSQYFGWYDSAYGNGTAATATANADVGGDAVLPHTGPIVCPLYLMAFRARYCGCVSSVCTLYVSGYGEAPT